MVKKSLVWLYSITTYLLWAIVIVVAAVVLLLRYYLLPHANDYREDIARYVSTVAGQRMTIGEIRAGWEGMHPYLDLYQVSLFDAQNRPALQLDHVATTLSWFSLPFAEPRLSRIALHQPQLTVRREADGTVYVAGISMSGPSRPAFPNWLLRQSRIDVTDATVTWQDDLRHAPPLILQKLSLRVSSPVWESLLGHHRFGLMATPLVAASAPIEIRGNFWGKDVSRLSQWHGTIYGKQDHTDIAVWHTWLDIPLDIVEGSRATQFWLDFAKGQTQKITSDVVFANVKMRFGKHMPEVVIKDLSGRLAWQRFDDGEEVRGKRLHLTTAEGFGIQQGTFQLRSRMLNDQEFLEGEAAVDALELESFAVFAGNLPLGEHIQDQLRGVAPKGHLQKTRFSWKGSRESIKEYHLQTRFAGLGVRPSHGIPGFSGLSGELDMTEQAGDLNIDSTRATLDLQNILRWPIPADRLTGQVKWQIKAGATEVQIASLAIANQHLSGSLDASFRYDGTKGGYLDLSGKFGNANGKFAKYYYPLVLDQETLDWLDTSIFNGRGENVQVVVKGYLDDFPYTDNKNGEFKVSARIDDALLDYANDWPKIEGVGLNLLFSGNRMDLSVDHGRVYGAQITRAKVSIPVLDADHPVLQIQGEVQAPAPDVLKFIDHSPVAVAIDHFTTGMKATGTGKVALNIQVPLDNLDETRVKGSYAVTNATLSGDASLPKLEQINGTLNFTESWVRAQNVTASIFGGPAQINMETGANHYLHATANGRIDSNGLRQMFDHPLLRRVQGTTDWEAEITHRDQLTSNTIRSTLTGIAFVLPPPFNKGATESWPLRVDVQGKDARQSQISVSLADKLSAKLLLLLKNGAGSTIERGEVNFGGLASLPAQAGIVVNGKLAQLDWDWWSEVLDNTEGAVQKNAFTMTGANLEIGTLDIYGRRINALNLKATAMADGWMSTVQSREINGDVRWQNEGKGKVLARLKSLQTPGAAPAKMSAPDTADQRQDYPALDINAEEFEIKDKKLGRLELLASQQGGDWNIQRLRISNADSTLNVDGSWHNWKSKPDTRVNVDWDIDDVGKTLDRFGYPGTIKGGDAKLSGSLKWNGGPHEFNLPGLGGDLQLEAKRGQFLKIQPGVGRLLGVLSLQALPRRLLFDFRDVFNDGFAFDLIGGTVQIDRGVMRSKDFKMEGPAAKVAISGETNLDRETLNLHIKVSPLLSDTLSLAALAGGPAVAAATFVAQKLLRDPLNKIAAYEYDIIGTWDDPQEVKSGAEKKETPTQSPLGK